VDLDENVMRERGEIVIYTGNTDSNVPVLPDAPAFGDHCKKTMRKLEKYLLQTMTMTGGRKYGGFCVDGIQNDAISNRLAINLGTAIWHRSQGGRFVTNEWHNLIPEFQLRVPDFCQLKSIFEQVTVEEDSRLRDTIPFVLQKSKTISDEHFTKEVSVMIKTYKELSNQQLKMFEIACLDQTADDFDDKCNVIEDVHTESRNDLSIKFSLEHIGKLLHKSYICTEFMQGISSKDNLIKHLKSAHDQRNRDLVEQDRRINSMVNRAVEQNQERNDRILEAQRAAAGTITEERDAARTEAANSATDLERALTRIANLENIIREAHGGFVRNPHFYNP